MKRITRWLRHWSAPVSCSTMIAVCCLCVCAMLTPTSPANAAVFCTVTAQSVAFGNISTVTNQNFDLYANYSVSCSGGSANESMIFCLYNWGSTNGGAGTSGPWYMKSGSNILNYNIYSDAGYSQLVGQGAFISKNFALSALGNGSTSLTFYYRIPSGQTTAALGNYTNTTNLLVKLGDLSTLTTSCNGGSPTQQLFPNSAVSATNQGQCTVTGGTLSFGSTGVLSTNVDATATITPNCTSGMNYNVSLDGGQNGGTNATNRKMVNGASSVTYGLYTNAARSTGWYGASVSGTGNGSNQPITVYGRVPPQTTPAPATYTDTVVITVTF